MRSRRFFAHIVCLALLPAICGVRRLPAEEPAPAPEAKYPEVFDKTIEDFSRYMAEKSDSLRGRAVAELQRAAEKGAIPKEHLVPVLVRLLKDPSRSIEQSAAFSLSKLGDASAVAPLKEATATRDSGVMYNVVGARLALGDPTAIEDLGRLLRGEDESTGLAAAHTLAGIKPPEASAALLEAIADEKPDVRLRAAYGLRFAKVQGGTEALAKALKDADARVRKIAADSLGSAGAKAAAAALIEIAAGDTDANVRQAAANSLGLMRAVEAREAVEKLLKGDTEPKVRAIAAVTLGSLQAWESKDALLAAARKADEDMSVRTSAIMALARLGRVEALDDLAPFLSDEKQPVRYGALAATAQYSDARLVAPLRKVLAEDKDASCRASAAYQLGKLKAKDAEEDLAKAWPGGDAAVRLNVLSALQNLESEKAAAIAVEALDDKTSGIRQAGISALAKLKKKDAAEKMLALAAKDADAGVRAAALQALPSAASPAAAGEALLSALADPAEPIRSAAYGALCSLTKQRFPFRPWAYENRREAEIARWRKWWQDEGKAAMEAKKE